MTALLLVAGLLLAVAGLLALTRVFRGPTSLDRALAVDVIVVLCTSSAAIFIAWTRDASSLPVLVVVSLTGFVGSVSVARFMAGKGDQG